MASYSYLFTDLLTGDILGDMPVNGVSFDRQMNKAGNLQGSTNLDNDFISNDDILALTSPGRSCIYVYRDDIIVWGGIIWTSTFQSQAKALSFTAQTFESYANRRIFKPTKTIAYNEAQCSIIQKLWQSLQSASNGNVGVDTDTLTLPSGDVVRQVTVNPWDMRKYGEIIDSITQFDDGADYTIEVFEDQGVPTKRLRLGYPRLGASIETTGMVIDYPGNILNYFWTINNSENNNRYYATGDGDESAMVIGSSTDQASLDSGYPLLEEAVSHQGVTVQATINAHAKADLANGKINKSKHTFQIKTEEIEKAGFYSVGDDVRIMIEDPRFPQGIDIVGRVVGWNATPASSEAVEELSLVLEGDEDA